MNTFLKELKTNPYIKLIVNSFRNYPQEVYLVGGYIRDLLLRRKKEKSACLPAGGDYDFAVSGDCIKVSREIAHSLRMGFVVLDEEHGSTRIVYRKDNFSCNFDFTDFRGKNIDEDLLRRDFTVNSLAINLKQIKRSGNPLEILLDRHSGTKDIRSGTIRVVSSFSLPEDPLRILRAFSLSAVLGFKIEPKTRAEIKRHKNKITQSAFERIAEELFKILNSQSAFKTFRAMDEFRILDEIMPEIKIMRGVNQGPYHHLDVFGHSFEALKQIEVLFSELKRNKDLQGYLGATVSGTHSRRALLKLGAFLHDIGKPDSKERVKGKTCFHGHERVGRNIARDISERLRLSTDERNALDKIIYWHLRPGYMADIDPLSRRAIYRFFRDTQNEAPAVLLLSIADQRSTRGPLTRGENRKHHEDVCLGLVKDFFRKAKEKKLPKLINGHDLISRFKLESGPLIGKILAEIEEEQAVGVISTKPQALGLAEKILRAKKEA